MCGLDVCILVACDVVARNCCTPEDHLTLNLDPCTPLHAPNPGMGRPSPHVFEDCGKGGPGFWRMVNLGTSIYKS